MNKVSSIRRTPAFLPHEEAEMREEFLAGVEVTELDAPVPTFPAARINVRGELVIKPTGLPPAEWEIL
ncbi:hypothetical protein [Variovorax sp. GT1P44]|uniref:hypothetical protein n=1 Tax=Variovorax sp. GT1P44 TaxID=3443742 RepID=UPI003F45E44C